MAFMFDMVHLILLSITILQNTRGVYRAVSYGPRIVQMISQEAKGLSAVAIH